MKETSLGDEALQGLEEAIRSESPGIEIVDFLGWRVFVEANSVPIYVRALADGAGLRNEFESLWNGGMPRVPRQLRLAWKGKSLFRAAWRMGASERCLDNKQTIVQFMDYLKSKGISDDVFLFIWKKHFEKDFSAGNKDLMTKDAKAILDEARRLQATHHPENGIPPSRNAPSFETIMAAEENQLHLGGVGV